MKCLWLFTGTTNCEPIIGSLEAHNNENYDLYAHDYFRDGNIVAAVEEVQPDIALYISVVAGPHLPTIEDLKKVKSLTKFVHICCDAGCKDWWELINEYDKEGCFDLTVNLDGNMDWPEHDTHVTALCPVDPRPYQIIPWDDKTVEVGFSGGDGSLERRKIMGALDGILAQKPRNEVYGSYDDYASFLLQTKISLNMSSTGPDDAKQVKARVIESGLAGCCLLEQEGSPIDKYFREHEHYETYKDENDVAGKIKELQADPYRMQLLAENLTRTVTTKYSADIFWKKVFGFVGLPW